MFLLLTRMPFTSSDTKPPATRDGEVPVFVQNESLFAWYSFKVKYDRFNSRTRGQTTFSQTIRRFSVEEACLPFVLITVCRCSSSSLTGRDCWGLSKLRVRLNPRFYNLITPWKMTVIPSGMHSTFFPENGKSIQSYMIFRLGGMGIQYLTLQLM